MERTGLLNNIYLAVEAIYEGRKWLDTDGLEHQGRISYNNGLNLALNTFREALSLAKDDLKGLILYESTFLTQELQFCGQNDTKTRRSLESAIQGFKDALRALKIVDVAASYQIAEQTYAKYGDQSRYHGMPKDAFHRACGSHKTRLNNILRSPGINLTEKKLLEQRLTNIITAQSVYYEKQKKVLTTTK